MNPTTNTEIDDMIEWLRWASTSPSLYASPDREKMDQARTMIQMLRARVDALEKAQPADHVPAEVSLNVTDLHNGSWQVHLATRAGLFPVGTPWHDKKHAEMYAEAIRQSMGGKARAEAEHAGRALLDAWEGVCAATNGKGKP